MAETQKARIAVIGTGWWATYAHIPALLKNDDAELVALCDIDSTKLARAADAFNIASTHPNVESLLRHETLDGVIVATHHAGHYEAVKTCLQAGLHVMVEKPMTLFAPHARELVELAAQQNRRLCIGYNHNYTQYTKRGRELMQAGTFGSVQYISGQFNQHVIANYRGAPIPREREVHGPGDVYADPARSGGGQGHLQITHLAGMIFFITGLRAKRVQALMHKHGLNVDLVNAILVEFENGALASIGGTGNLGGGGRKIALQIYCEDGWIDIDEVKGAATIQGEGFEREDFAPLHGAAYVHPLDVTINNLVDVILGRAPNGSPGEIGWRAVELLDAAYRSAARDGAAVTIDELYE